MRATTSIIFIAGLISTAFAADTIQFSDDACKDQIAKDGFGGLSTGDIPILDNAKSIKVDSFSDVWFAYQDSDGDNCKGDLLTRLDNDECIKTTDLGIGCTRLCGGGLGGGDCASTTA
ncbi:hypothetical protein N8I77_002810 [Diaporthe amygdali]|uniref:Uncharacterized protein n=1 Tax=Phomopsis amygdali TaxID=1214568 RepID=A0AAD9STI0_PHOAM|nr:uncharacterized protein J7T55_006914 [Diaporthe amygdali]KAJ0107036.1 hypothetical protein J7T55_006914 [Diaporthe amygdali]KAK2616101.1 hypothetical protein N8I77_002810 [Diaporthe amygdali]